MDIRAYADMFSLEEIAQNGYSYLSQPITHEGLVYRTDSGTLAVDGYELQDNEFCEFLYYDEWEDAYYWNTDRYFAEDERFICSGEYIEEGKTIVRVRGDKDKCKYKRYRVGILALDGETWIDVGDFNDYDEALGYANYFLLNPHSSVCFDIDEDADEDELFGKPLARITLDNNPNSTRYYML